MAIYSANWLTSFHSDLGTIKYIKDVDDADLDTELSVYDALVDAGLAAETGRDQTATVKIIREQGRVIREGSVVPDLSAPHYHVPPPHQRPPVPLFAQTQPSLGKRSRESAFEEGEDWISSSNPPGSNARHAAINENQDGDTLVLSLEHDNSLDEDFRSGARRRHAQGLMQNSQAAQTRDTANVRDTLTNDVLNTDVEVKSESPEPRTALQSFRSTSVIDLDVPEIAATTQNEPQRAASSRLGGRRQELAEGSRGRTSRKSLSYFSPGPASRRSSGAQTSIAADTEANPELIRNRHTPTTVPQNQLQLPSWGSRPNAPITPPSDVSVNNDASNTKGRLSRPTPESAKILVKPIDASSRFKSNVPRNHVYEAQDSEIEDSQMSPRSRGVSTQHVVQASNSFSRKRSSSSGEVSELFDDRTDFLSNKCGYNKPKPKYDCTKNSAFLNETDATINILNGGILTDASFVQPSVELRAGASDSPKRKRKRTKKKSHVEGGSSTEGAGEQLREHLQSSMEDPSGIDGAKANISPDNDELAEHRMGLGITDSPRKSKKTKTAQERQSSSFEKQSGAPAPAKATDSPLQAQEAASRRESQVFAGVPAPRTASMLAPQPQVTDVLDVKGGEEVQLRWIEKNVFLPPSVTPMVYLARRMAGPEARRRQTASADDLVEDAKANETQKLQSQGKPAKKVRKSQSGVTRTDATAKASKAQPQTPVPIKPAGTASTAKASKVVSADHAQPMPTESSASYSQATASPTPSNASSPTLKQVTQTTSSGVATKPPLKLKAQAPAKSQPAKTAPPRPTVTASTAKANEQQHPKSVPVKTTTTSSNTKAITMADLKARRKAEKLAASARSTPIFSAPQSSLEVSESSSSGSESDSNDDADIQKASAAAAAKRKALLKPENRDQYRDRSLSMEDDDEGENSD